MLLSVRTASTAQRSAITAAKSGKPRKSACRSWYVPKEACTYMYAALGLFSWRVKLFALARRLLAPEISDYLLHAPFQFILPPERAKRAEPARYAIRTACMYYRPVCREKQYKPLRPDVKKTHGTLPPGPLDNICTPCFNPSRPAKQLIVTSWCCRPVSSHLRRYFRRASENFPSRLFVTAVYALCTINTAAQQQVRTTSTCTA